MVKHFAYALPFALTALAIGIGSYVPASAQNAIAQKIASSHPAAISPTPPSQVRLGTYLFQAGKQLNCYFTVENVFQQIAPPKPGEPESTLPDNIVPWNDVVSSDIPQTIPLLIAQLQRELPKATILRDRHNPIIIHIVDSSLMNDSDYILNKKKSLVAHTKPDWLVNLVGKMFPLPLVPASELPHDFLLKQPLSGLIGIQLHSQYSMFNDDTTDLSVKANQQTVREIFSDFVPLKGYSRVIWIAEKLNYNEPIVSNIAIGYYGPTAPS